MPFNINKIIEQSVLQEVQNNRGTPPFDTVDHDQALKDQEAKEAARTKLATQTVAQTDKPKFDLSTYAGRKAAALAQGKKIVSGVGDPTIADKSKDPHFQHLLQKQNQDSPLPGVAPNQPGLGGFLVHSSDKANKIGDAVDTWKLGAGIKPEIKPQEPGLIDKASKFISDHPGAVGAVGAGLAGTAALLALRRRKQNG